MWFVEELRNKGCCFVVQKNAAQQEMEPENCDGKFVKQQKIREILER